MPIYNVGYWCLHCEVTSFKEYVKTEMEDGMPYVDCPFCGADHFDMWRIKGKFQHGEYVETGSDELIKLQAFKWADDYDFNKPDSDFGDEFEDEGDDEDDDNY